MEHLKTDSDDEEGEEEAQCFVLHIQCGRQVRGARGWCTTHAVPATACVRLTCSTGA